MADDTGGFLGLSPAEIALILGSSLQGLRVGSPEMIRGGGGFRPFMPLAALGQVLGQKEERQRQQQQQKAAVEQLQQMFPDLQGQNLSSLSIPQLFQMVGLQQQAQERKAQDQGLWAGLQAMAPVQAEGPPPLAEAPPEESIPIPAEGGFGGVRDQIAPDLSAPDMFQLGPGSPVSKQPSTTDIVKSLAGMEPRQRGVAARVVLPELIKRTERDTTKQEDKAERTKAALAWSKAASEAGVPAQRVRQEVSNYLFGVTDKLPPVSPSILPPHQDPLHVTPGSKFVDPMTGREIASQPATPKELSPEIQMEWDAFQAEHPGESFWAFEKARRTDLRPPEKPERPTDRDKAIGDYIEAKGLPNTAANRLKAREAIKEEGSGAAQFTPDALEMAAQTYLRTGQLPPMGLSRKGADLRVQIINRATQIAADTGIGLEGQAARQALFKANQTELNRIQGQRGVVLSFARTAHANLAIAEGLSDKVDRSGVPVLNRWIQVGRRSVAGDKDLVAFDAAIRVGINEFAKVTSSATGGGVTSDQARKEIEQMLNAAQTPEQFKAVLGVLRQDLGNRERGYDEQIAVIRGSLGQLSPAYQQSQPPETPAPGLPGSPAQDAPPAGFKWK